MESLDPLDQSIHIRVSAHSVKTLDPGVYFDLLPEKLYILLPLEKPSSQSPVCLIPDKQDRTLRTPKVVLQMMTDPARITHAGCRDDHLWFFDEIDHLGIVTRRRGMKSRKDQRVDSGIYQSERFLIKTVPHIFCEYFRRLDRQRAVKIYIKVLVLF